MGSEFSLLQPAREIIDANVRIRRPEDQEKASSLGNARLAHSWNRDKCIEPFVQGFKVLISDARQLETRF